MPDFMWNDQAQAPDVLGRIIACRAWRMASPLRHIGPNGALYSVGVNPVYGWTEGPNRAQCAWGGRYFTPTCQRTINSRAPVAYCGCGFWGLSSWRTLREAIGYSGGQVVWGLVAMWGRIVPGTLGWRSEFAQITAVSDRNMARRYDVPHLRSFDQDVLDRPWHERRREAS